MERARTPQGNLLLVTVILSLMIFGNIAMILLGYSSLLLAIKVVAIFLIGVAEIVFLILLIAFGSWRRR